MRRRLPALAGTLAVGVGLVLTVRPGLVPEFDLATVLVLGVWLLALGQFVVVAVRWLGDRERSEPLPAVDGRPSYSVPGADVAETLATTTPSAHHAEERSALRSRLRSVAVATLSRTDGVDERTARDRLEAGTWTADDDAAALFAPDDSDESDATAHGALGFPRRVRAAADELWRLAEEDRR